MSLLIFVKVEVIPIKFPVVRETKIDEIAKFLSNYIENGDIVAVCSSLISRAEGRVKKLDEFTPTKKAIEIAKKIGEDARFVQAVLDESEEILIEYPFLLVKSKSGNICVNAGIDRSNVESGFILLLPKDPDKSAEKLRRIFEKMGFKVGVVITDTNGRCFRKGVTGFAVGASGLITVRNWINSKDLFDNTLKKTQECIVDEIAAFANLIMGEGGDSIPAVVFRGLDFVLSTRSEGVKSIYRNDGEDIIRRIIREWRKSLLQE